MPLYTYQCNACGLEMDRDFRVADFPREIECSSCGNPARKIISTGHGGIQTDGDVSWLPSACDVLQRPSEPRLTTRTEYRAYLKKEGLTPCG